MSEGHIIGKGAARLLGIDIENGEPLPVRPESAGWVENGCSLPVGEDCPVTGIPCDECGFGQPND